jgi:class 3 adenylate cyclase
LRDEAAESPRGFAFVAVYNADTTAAKAIRDMKMVESWSVVGECWDKGSVISDNDLQANVRHMASYDNKSGFTAMHTLVVPVRFQNRQIGVLQVLNKSVGADSAELDPQGFSPDDRKALSGQLNDTADGGLAMLLHYFLSDSNCTRFLGVQGELDLENAVIMYADLTRSSSLFSELPLLDAAKLINRFDEELYRRMQPHAAVVEKFNGDGTMIRFHYGGFKPDSLARNPAYRAASAAAEIVSDFEDFKAKYWKPLADNIADKVLLRMTIALGPVISTNVGPRQFQVPTVLGQCVNRAAKMAAYAPRDRNVVLVDDNVRKTLLQLDRSYGESLRDYSGFALPDTQPSESLARHAYYELDIDRFVQLKPRTRRLDDR